MVGTALIITSITAFAVTSILGVWLIPFLRKLKYGQTILDIGPSWHKNKQGTPTMGGILFIIGIIIASVTGFLHLASRNEDFISSIQMVNNAKFFAGILLACGFGLIGFSDDYIKVVKKQNLGLNEKQKLIAQILIAMIYLFVIYKSGDTSTYILIPFWGQLDIGLLYYPFALITIVGFVNAVNLTDGIDGLAASVTFVYGLCFMVITSILGFVAMNLLATALAAACLGFLVWNFFPAKVFMGDTGSMFLGGIALALAFGVGMPTLIFIVGFVYFCEAFSVILQVISVKTRGKRIFKMSPIHHHFELSGYSELKIVALFTFLTAVMGVVAVLAVVAIQ